MTTDVIDLRHGGHAVYWCPGCRELHCINVDAANGGVTWAWNGDKGRPTISPSVNVSPQGPRRCHHFIRDGQIQFLSDCQHEMAGKTVPLPPVPPL